MRRKLDRTQAGAIAPRLAAVGALIGATLVAAPHFVATHATAVHSLAASDKPNSRVDAANSGVEANRTGPISGVTQTYNGADAIGGSLTGAQLDAAGNLVFGKALGTVYSYKIPAAPGALTQNWSSTVGATGGNPNGTVSSVTLSSDGGAYVGDDSGKVWQINVPAAAAGTAPAAPIFTSAARMEMTPNFDSNNHLLIGDDGGTFYSLTPPALGAGTTVTPNFSFAATGSTQAAGTTYAGTASSAPFSFFGEAAVDPANNIYVASSDTNPAISAQTLGTLYALSSSGTVLWKAPLQGPVINAVIYDGKVSPAEVIVANKGQEVAAFNAATGAVIWDKLFAGAFQASPALSPDGKTVYAQDTSANLLALNATTGATIFTAPVQGTANSPIVDSQGNIYVVDGGGKINLVTSTGTASILVAGGTAAGQSGGVTGPKGSLVVSPDGTLFFSSGQGRLRGFSGSLPPTNTPIPTNSPTITNTPTSTSTPSATSSPTNSPTVTSTPSSTSTSTPVPPTSTFTPVPTITSTPVVAGNCQLYVLPNPETIQQGGSEAILYKALSGTTITTQILTGGSYPTTATLYNSPLAASYIGGTATPGIGGTVISSTPYPATGPQTGVQFTFTVGGQGRALLDFPIPASATIGKVTVNAKASESCHATASPGAATPVPGALVTLVRTAVFNVEAPAANSFSNILSLNSRDEIIRTVELPQAGPPVSQGTGANRNPDSVKTLEISLHTAPGASVQITALLNCKYATAGTAYGPTPTPTGPGSLHSSCGLGNGSSALAGQVNTDYTVAANDTLLTTTKTASAKGYVLVPLTLTSALLVPGHGARVTITAKIVYNSTNPQGTPTTVTLTPRKTLAITEIHLRLLVQPKEGTRGDRRQVFQVGHTKGGSSTFSVLVLADKGATIAGTASFPSTTIGTPALNIPQNGTPVAGPGGRVTLKFTVPNSVATTNKTHALGTVTVTSSFRGTTITRTVRFSYGTR